MGNGASSSGTLHIVLDPPSSRSSNGAYIAGQTISGSVYAQSKTNVSSPLHIEAYISGKERSVVRYDDTEHYHDHHSNEQRSRSVTRYRRSNRQIIHAPVHLADVNTGVNAGAQYRFPFRIQLPPDLPSTMFCEESGNRGGHAGGHDGYADDNDATVNLLSRGGYYGNGHCGITYKFKAVLHGSGMFGNHKIEQEIKVVSKPLPYNQPLPNLIQPVTHKVHYCCCCISAGEITMGARVEDTRMGQGEMVAIDFACKNQSRQSIDHVEVDVKEDVQWYADGRYNYSSRVIAQQTFRPTGRWDTLSKDEVKELKAKSKSPTDSFRDQRQLMLQKIHEAIFNGENRAMLNIPASCLQSYEGVLIKVNHRLKIKIYTGGTCTDKPTIKLPVYIGTPSSILPQPEPPVTFPMPSAPLAMPTPIPSAPPDEWAGCLTATLVVVGQSAALVGGNTIWEAEGDYDPKKEDEVVMAVAEVVPSLPNLLKEIGFAVSPLLTVQNRLGEDEWRAIVFSGMTPSGYASVIKAVAIEFDHPEMAALVAPAVANFTHQYILAALQVVADWIRTPLLSKVLPLCQDLAQNGDKIKEVLTDWERVCTKQDFEEALKS